mmetsp:Transcript_79926/g.158329  ORF Transcript_79926/g.158329 Transcript_79926/m.158329 type:complete len:1265 (-) Transcript_79926:154-3948(-)
MHHMNSRSEDTRGDGASSHKPRARLVMSGGSTGGLTGCPPSRRPSKVDDKPMSHSPPVQNLRTQAQLLHAQPPRRSTSFSVKASSPVTRSGGDHLSGSYNPVSSAREPIAQRSARLSSSSSHGGHHSSLWTSAAGHTPVATQVAHWESSPRLPQTQQQQQQQQQQQEPFELGGSQGASGEVSVPSSQTPRFARSPADNIGKEPKQQQTESCALPVAARELFATANGPDNDGTPQSSVLEQEGKEHETDAYKQILEQVGAERSARVRDCAKIHMTLDELRGRLASGLCEAEEAAEARLVARLSTLRSTHEEIRERVGKLENRGTEQMTEQFASEVHRHLDSATAAAVKVLEGRFPSAEVIQKLEEQLPSAVALSEVEARLTAVEQHHTAAIAEADTRSSEQLYAFRTECEETCRGICSEMLQQFEAQSGHRVANALQEQLRLGLDDAVGAAEIRLRNQMEAERSSHATIGDSHGSKLSSLEAAHDHHRNLVESHGTQLSDLATAHKDHLCAVEAHKDQLKNLEAAHGHANAVVQSHGSQLSSLKDAHSHHATIMESHKAILGDLEERHVSNFEIHKHFITDLQAAHSHHASTLESLQQQVNAIRNLDELVKIRNLDELVGGLSADMDAMRNLDQLVSGLSTDMDVIRQQQQEQTASTAQLCGKINDLDASLAECSESHKLWKTSHQELFQAQTTRADAFEDNHTQHCGDLETMRGQVTMLENDLQGTKKSLHNLVADMQTLMEREQVPQAKEAHDSQEPTCEGSQTAEKLEALTCLMSAFREEIDILRAQSAEGGVLHAELGALRLELSQANDGRATFESFQVAINRQESAMEAVVSQVSSIMSELDALKNQQPGDPASQQQDLHKQLEEHMAAFAGFRDEFAGLKAVAAETPAFHSSWHEANKDSCSEAEEGHAAPLAKAAETRAIVDARLEALTAEFQADREATRSHLDRVWGALEQVGALPGIVVDPQAKASTDMTATLTTDEAAPDAIRECQVEPFCSGEEDRLERQHLAAELHQKIECGLERLRVELGADLTRMELQLGQELPEHWNVTFSAHEKLLISIQRELEDMKVMQEQGLQASEAAEELFCALEGAKEVTGLEENIHTAAEMSNTDEEKIKDHADTVTVIASLRGEVGSLKATQDLQSHDLKVLENAVTGHFEDMRAMFGHVEESVQQLHCKMDRSDTTDMGHRISAMEQIRQEDRAAVDVMMAEQRRRENLLTEAGACISRLCRFKDKLVIGPAQDGDASEASASEGGLASVSV